MIASANASEVGVLSNSGDAWTQWTMPDYARAELPLREDYQETLPIGLTLDISSTTPLPWGEATVPPCPLLCVLSDEGLLSCYNVVFLKEGIPSVCTPPDSVSDQTGLSFFTTTSQCSGLSQVTPVKPPVATQIETLTSDTVPVSKSFPFETAIQSTPVISNKMLPNTGGPFGEQATLTPIKATPLFGGQTLVTPINKSGSDQGFASIQKPVSVNEKYTPLLAALNTSSTVQLPQAASVKPILITGKPEEKSIQDTATQEPTKAAKAKPEVEITPELRAETAAMLSQIIKDEWLILETELRFLLKQCQSIKINVGSDQEKVDMIEQIENLQSFLKEAVDISVGQSSEIHCLKQNVIQSWAWFEEARSHYNVSKNATVALLMKLQPLDSVAEKKLKDIKQLICYIESQLSQVNKTLDEQWENFQNHTRNKYKVKLPTMEAIFQTMVRQSAVLQRQTYVLKDISMRLSKKTSVSSSMLLSLDKLDDLKNLHLSTHDVLELQREKIKHYTNNLTMNKTNNLRKLLINRPVTKVIAVKPQISSWVIGQTSASKIRESLANLAISKASVARNLSFTQPNLPKDVSTTCIKEDKKTMDLPTLATTTTANPVSSSTGFIPLPKNSSIINTQSSAFAATGSISSTITTDQKTASKSSLNFSPAPTSNTFNFGFDNNAISIIKPTINNVTKSLEKPSDPTNLPTSFGQKNTATPVNTNSSTSSIFSPTTSGAFSFSTPISQVGKLSSPSTSAASTAVNLVKPIQPPSTIATGTSLFGAKPSIFGAAASNKVQTTISAQTPSSIASLFGAGSAISITKVVPSTANVIFATPFSSSAVTATSSPKFVESAPIFGQPVRSPEGATQSTFNLNTKTNTYSSASPTQAATVRNSNKSLFEGSPAISLTPLPFGGSTTTASIFGTTSIKTVPPTPFGTATTASGSLFGTATTSSSSLFGTTTTASGSLFGTASTASSSLFGTATATSSSLFGTPTTSSSLFGNPAAVSLLKKSDAPALSTTVISSTPSIFGNLATTVAPSSDASLFGNKAAVVTAVPSSTPSLFGNVVTTTAQSMFGNVQTASEAPLFGVPTTTTTATTLSDLKPPLFGTVASTVTSTTNVTTSPTSSIFGSKFNPISSTSTSHSTTATSSNKILISPNTTSIFGSGPNTSVSSTTTTATTSSIFGQPICNTFPTSTTSSNIFSGAGTSNIFGQTSTSASTNIFASPEGSITTTTSSTTASIFGQGTTVTSTSSSSFGTPSTTTSFGTQNNSIFGGNKPSVFGQASFGNQSGFNVQQPQATTSSSVFGQGSTFGSGAVFGQQATTTASSVFGNVSSSNNSFGSGFGSPATTTASLGTFGLGGLTVGGGSGGGFGGTGSVFSGAPAANPFGKVEPKSTFATGTSNTFGSPASTSASIFGSSTTSSSSIFGGNTTSVFGSSAGGFSGTTTTQNSFTSSPFGQKPAFGQAAGFGSSSPFGSQQNPGAFSGGSSSSVSQTGFASPTAFQKPSGFGSPPVFGGAAQTNAFGAAPSFGTTPSFGSAPAFGSPEKVFGASTLPSAPFGSVSAQQQNAGFGNIASQNTIGFGNLAQQASTPNSMSFSGGSSFSSWR